MPIFRIETNDNDIWNNIVAHNEYQLPDDLTGWIVIDVGAHIGAFSYACVERGAQRVYAIEASQANYRLLTQELADYIEERRVWPTRAAVWRSDELASTLYLSDATEIDGRINSGSFSFITGKGIEAVPTISLDHIIRHATGSNKNSAPILLKLDCEGSEWPILYTSKMLGKLEQIIGEYHCFELPFEINNKTKFDIGDLMTFLNRSGFTVEAFSHNSENILGMFFAKRL